jgi:hypothetical protein
MDLFPLKFTYGARTPLLLKYLISGVAIAANLAFWFLFAAVLAAGVKYGINFR